MSILNIYHDKTNKVDHVSITGDIMFLYHSKDINEYEFVKSFVKMLKLDFTHLRFICNGVVYMETSIQSNDWGNHSYQDLTSPVVCNTTDGTPYMNYSQSQATTLPSAYLRGNPLTSVIDPTTYTQNIQLRPSDYEPSGYLNARNYSSDVKNAARTVLQHRTEHGAVPDLKPHTSKGKLALRNFMKNSLLIHMSDADYDTLLEYFSVYA